MHYYLMPFRYLLRMQKQRLIDLLQKERFFRGIYRRLMRGRFRIKVETLIRCYERPGVTEVSVPYGIKTIGDGAFTDCTNLRSVRLPEGLLMIKERSFMTRQNIDRLIGTATERGHAEITMLLLNYKNQRFGIIGTEALRL